MDKYFLYKDIKKTIFGNQYLINMQESRVSLIFSS